MSRVLMVLRPDEGGAFRHVADLSRGVAAAGHEVAVCGPLAHRAEDLGVPVIPLDMARAISPRHDAASAAGLVRVVRRYRPDLIHAHGSKASVYARVARPAYPRVPVLYTPHGYPFAGYFSDPASKRRYRGIERGLSRLATRVICVCEAERRLAASVGPAETTRVVHNGTEDDPSADVFPPVAELGGGGPLVAVVSGLRPGKGIETLVEAWARIAPSHPAARLVVAGDGPERSKIESLAAELGVEPSLHLVGHSPGAEPILAGADIFVNPSWAESFPYALLEAMAFGLPIAATDVGGCGEAIEDGLSGRLVPARDAESLAAAIGELLDAPELARALGDAARARHGERFTLDEMVQGNLAVYRELNV
jgi:glycosyltransferase involved in cell wall biosynthesis